MWTCPKCERQNADDLAYCALCGASREKDALDQKAEQKHPRSKTVFSIKIVLSILVVILNTLVQALNSSYGVAAPYFLLLILSLIPMLLLMIWGKSHPWVDFVDIALYLMLAVGGLVFLVSPLVDTYLIRIAAGCMTLFSIILMILSIFSLFKQGGNKKNKEQYTKIY